MKNWRSAFLLVTNDKSCFGASLFPLSNVFVTFLLTSFRKGYFLRRRLRHYRFLMAEIAVLMFFFFYIRLQASSLISMRNRSVYNVWIIFSILLTLFSEGSINPMLKLSCQFQFALLKAFQYIRIFQRNTGFYPKHLLRWRSRRLETHLSWNYCIAKNVWMFHNIYSGILRGESTVMSGRAVHA